MSAQTNTKRPAIGGAAILEGVMMRSPSSFAVVVRRKNGELVVREQPMPVRRTGPWALPLARGVRTLVDTVRLQSRAMKWAAAIWEADLDEEEAPPSKPAKAAKKAGRAALGALVTTLSLASLEDPTPEKDDEEEAAPAPKAAAAPKEFVAKPTPSSSGGAGQTALAVLMALGLYVVAPQAAAELFLKLSGHGDTPTTSPLFQAVTGASKLLIVVALFSLLRRVPDIYRVFQYHGAEHKTISTHEHDEALDVAHARPYTTAHARCGTTFIVMVALVSILLFSAAGAFLPRLPGGRIVEHVGLFLMKLPLLPVIAGITYEIQRGFAQLADGPLRVLLWPGFLVQRITTAPPDDAQLEVALASMRATLWREAEKEAPTPPDRAFEGYAAVAADPGYAR